MPAQPWGRALAALFLVIALAVIVTALTHPSALRDAVTNLSPAPAEVAPAPVAGPPPAPQEIAHPPVVESGRDPATPTTTHHSTTPHTTTPACVTPNSDSP